LSQAPEAVCILLYGRAMISSILFVILAVALALALAYLPMKLLLGHIAKTVSAFIERQRERRRVERETPDRRKVDGVVKAEPEKG
jgi:hypothetical protein